MEYEDIKNLIDNTLSNKESGHEITPLEHQNILMAVLNYAHDVAVLGQSVLQGFADVNTAPETPDNAKLCYIALCPSNAETVFNYFSDSNGDPITVTCTSNQVKFVVLLWNTAYWEKIEQSLTV